MCDIKMRKMELLKQSNRNDTNKWYSETVFLWIQVCPLCGSHHEHFRIMAIHDSSWTESNTIAN